jgi:hypothetical protein
MSWRSQRCRRGHHVLRTAHLRLQTPADRDRMIMSAVGSDPEAQRWLGWAARQVIPERQRGRLLAMEPGRAPARLRYRDNLLLAVDRCQG